MAEEVSADEDDAWQRRIDEEARQLEARLQRRETRHRMRQDTALMAGVSARDGRHRYIDGDEPLHHYPDLIDELYTCIHALGRRIRALETRRK